MRAILLGLVCMWLLLTAPRAAAQTAFPCTNGNCLTVGPSSKPQGWIVGEIRAFAFGGDSKLLIEQMAQNGWVECAGQSAIRADFSELWRVIGTDWGNLDQNTFLLPDLRGLFVRGWQHEKSVPPDPATHMPPYTGDIDVSYRKSPRPEAGDAGGNSGATGDHVGSVQAENVGQHSHPFSYNAAPHDIQPAYDPGNREHLTTSQNAVNTTTGLYPSGESGPIEDHPSNAFVMYFIYVGKPAQVIEATPEEKKKGPLVTDRIECKKQSGKCML
jgi:microcystin-dependent protein